MEGKSWDRAEVFRRLAELYYDPQYGYTSAERFYDKVKWHVPLTRQQVVDWVNTQTVTQTHRKKKKPRLYVPIRGGFGSYQSDLMFVPALRELNDGYDTILTIIEITTRVGYAYALRGKKSRMVRAAMQRFLGEINGIIQVMETDAGTEFTGDEMQQFFKLHDVLHIQLEPGMMRPKGKIERFNRTVRDMLFRVMTARDNLVWVDVLDDVILNYNTSSHSGIGMAPFDVGLFDEIRIRSKDNVLTRLAYASFDIQVGDRVRVLQAKRAFEKSSTRNFSRTVYQVVGQSGVRYTIADLQGDEIQGRYYHDELRRV